MKIPGLVLGNNWFQIGDGAFKFHM
jgi:hypothetical protein